LGTMTRTRRNFTLKTIIDIQEGEREGIPLVTKVSIAPSLYARWKHKYLNEALWIKINIKG